MGFPNIRKGSGKPKAFSRPAIDLDRPTRTWRDISAHEIQLEDTVPDVGRVVDIQTSRPGDDDYVWVLGAGGKAIYFRWDEPVFTFTTKK
jgi:hypothetical protein